MLPPRSCEHRALVSRQPDGTKQYGLCGYFVLLTRLQHGVNRQVLGSELRHSSNWHEQFGCADITKRF